MLGLPYNRIMIIHGQSLSSGLEDYIEAIYISQLANEQLKGAELARKLNISRASVSEALSKLVAKGLVSYNRYEYISLTKEGETEARQVYEKHHIIEDFLENVLGVSSSEASDNACKIEHIISENILLKLAKFSEFFKKHKKILDLYIEESETDAPNKCNR